MRLMDTLRRTLEELVRSSAGSSPAFDTLLSDYRDYHAVLLALGGPLTAGLLALSVLSWRRLRRTPKRRTFERRAYRAFALAGGVVGLGCALVFAANLSTVLAPRQGFAHVIPALGTPASDTEQARLHRSVTRWLESDRADVPPLLRRKVDDRLAWQRPKAIVCALLLIPFAAFSVRFWRRSLARGRASRSAVTAGAAASVGALVLAVMVIANTQAAFAPVTLTLLYG